MCRYAIAGESSWEKRKGHFAHKIKIEEKLKFPLNASKMGVIQGKNKGLKEF